MANLNFNKPQTGNTELPPTLQLRQQKAESFLNLFSKNTGYLHGELNPYLKWLKSNPKLNPTCIYQFLNFWYPVSRHQPQILWRIASLFPDWTDRHLIILNAIEEDGHLKSGDNPHYDLLEELIIKIGGKLEADQEAEDMVNKFHKSIDGLTPFEAIGYLAAIEHPALDISNYFTSVVSLCGYKDLLRSDNYLKIHIEVEPNHLIWSHGNALDWMQDQENMKKYGYAKEDITGSFTVAMSFWNDFWKLAFIKLGYPS